MAAAETVQSTASKKSSADKNAAALKSASDETSTRRFHYNVTTARLDEFVNLLTAAVRDPALERDPAMRGAAGAAANVRVTAAGHGEGVYEAVITTLAERRGASA